MVTLNDVQRLIMWVSVISLAIVNDDYLDMFFRD